MTDSTPPSDFLARLAEALGAYGVTDFAVTGGAALGAWVPPRETRDVDLCAVVPAASIPRMLARYDGVRGGTGEIPDVMRLSIGSWDIDVFPVKDDYDMTCLGRATEADIGGVRLKVVTPEDFVIHKLVKLRVDRRRLLQDATDLRAVIAAKRTALDFDYLRRWLPAVEAAFVEHAGAMSDADLVQRLSALPQR